MTEEAYMERALKLAELGRGRTSPNPVVGAVIVKGGKIIGEGYHQRCGENHAEINAFENAAEDVAGADLYVTLEPCSHHGKTPPCAKAIIQKKIGRVFVGMKDPNPLVAGRGLRMMADAGIQVKTGILEAECRRKNEIFIRYITSKRPFVVMKTAMTLDGKIAAYTGDSKWVSCEESRSVVQKMRNSLTGIMVGIGTVLADDPQLTCRLPDGRDPVRIIVDSNLRIPLNAKVLDDANCIVAASPGCGREKKQQLKARGIQVLEVNGDGPKVDLSKLMEELGKLEIDSILLEGGGTLNEAALRAGIVDRVVSFIAPKLIGGKEAKTPVEGEGLALMEEALTLQAVELQKVGTDILVSGTLRKE